jgi:hypothetical protein
MSVCGKCHQENERHYKFCLGCGAELPSDPAMPTPTTRGWLDEEPAAVAPALRPAQDASAPSSARTCPSCGNVVSSSFTFCGQCGGRLDAPAPTQRNAASGGVTGGMLVLVRADGSEGGSHALHVGINLIGRGQGPLFDADGYLSPRHAELELGPEGAIVRDAGSLNGVFLRTSGEEELVDGAVFRVGQELLRFEALPPAEPLPDDTHIMGSPPGNAWGRLALIVSRSQDGSAFPLAGESVLLGRERGDIVFSEDGYVSGTHARISQRDGRCYLTDLNSSNGTFIRLREPRAIGPGAFLLMGQQLFRVALS